MNRIYLLTKVLLGAAALGLLAPSVQAGHSDEATLKLVQTSKYNVLTGNWDVVQGGTAPAIAKDFKKNLPRLDYHLVQETVNGSGRIVLTFRGEGDQRVIVKLKELEDETNVRIRVGALGNEAKSSQLFSYVYKNN